MRLDALLELLKAPEMARSGPQRLRGYLLVTSAALWACAVALVLLGVTVLGSTDVLRDAVVVAVAGSVVLVGLWLAERGRTAGAAVLVLATNWVLALALTWDSPRVAPVGLLAVLVPLVIVAEYVPARVRSVVAGVTVPLAGAVVFLRRVAPCLGTGRLAADPGCGHGRGRHRPRRRRPRRRASRPRPAARAAQRRELEESRARVAGAALEARRSIERDLHDGAQQRLATMAVDLGRAHRLCDAEPDRARQIVHGLQGQLEEAIREPRDLAHGIYPPLLNERGLGGALPAAARRTALPCIVEVRGVRRYDRSVEAAVYFSCLEAMQNADRHSGGSLITVAVLDDGAALRFSVADDGVGFDRAETPGARGITNIRDRVRAAGGELTLTSTRGAGSTVAGVFHHPVRPA